MATAIDELELVRSRFRSTPPRQALDELMEVAREAGFRFVYRLGAVRSVEFTNGRNNIFSAQAANDHVNFYLRSPALTRMPGLRARAVEQYGPQKPNKRGEYRIHVCSVSQARRLVDWLLEVGAWPELAEARADTGPSDMRRDGRMRATEFAPVTPDHLYRAGLALVSGAVAPGFIGSTNYDVLFGDSSVPPKAMFGLAATYALGRPIGPKDFSGGLGTPCFRAIEYAGYTIVRKDAARPTEQHLSLEDRQWAEGDAQLVTHLKKERGDGLAAAKRASFVARHGRLFCERCNMDPVVTFASEDGAACIEVHHSRVAVADMKPGHVTDLDDLQCLCANCHRFVHRQLKRATQSRLG